MNELDEIKQRILIPDIAAKAGVPFNKNNFAKSIYKQERAPSMKYYPADNTFWCFSTARGGSVIDFYVALYNVDVATAIKELKALAGIDGTKNFNREPVQPLKQEVNFEDCLSDEEKYFYEERLGINEHCKFEDAKEMARREVQKHRIEKNSEVFTEFRRYVIVHDLNYKAVDYLTKTRRLDLSTVERFGVFAFNNYNKINEHLKKQFHPDQLQRSGLFNERNNLIFFKHRIVIPYYYNNKIVYLRGRYFDEDNNHQTDSFKYLGVKNDALNVNSPKRFYNIDRLRALEKGKRLFIVEGEFDAIAIESIDLAAVAVVGAGNIPPRSKFKPLLAYKIIIVVDNDEAGEGLKNKLVEIVHSFGVPVYVRKLKKHKDFNELLINTK